MANDLPTHARERLADMRARRLFTSDLSVNEFLLVREAGFDPVGLVMGSSIYRIAPDSHAAYATEGSELGGMTRALNHARQLAMQRMEEEADELGADGVVGVRLTVNLGAGVTAVRCYDATKKSCEVKGESTAAGVDSVKASCTAGGGTPVDACPSAGLQGCCVVAGLGTCTYDPTAVATLQSACPLGGATWSTTAP